MIFFLETSTNPAEISKYEISLFRRDIDKYVTIFHFSDNLGAPLPILSDNGGMVFFGGGGESEGIHPRGAVTATSLTRYAQSRSTSVLSSNL